MTLEDKKKLSYKINRDGDRPPADGFGPMKHTYTFKCAQYLEKIDDLSDMSSYSYGEIQEKVVEMLTDEFRMALNHVVFGHGMGREFVEANPYFHGRKMKHDGYPIDKDGEMVEVYIDGPLEGSDDLIKCHFYDEHFTNHIADKQNLHDND